MEPLIKPIARKLILDELTSEKYIRNTRRGGNELYEITNENSPNTMREIGRLRELSFRTGGGGTGKSCDIDSYDIDSEFSYKQLIVWDPKDEEIIGGYRYILCNDIETKHLATSHLFDFSDEFIKNYLPLTIELGRSFIQPNYQGTNLKRKGLYSLDNIWDGLGALTVKYDEFKYFFGKVTMYQTYNSNARNTLLHFLNKYFSDNEKLVTPFKPLNFENDNIYYKSLFNNLSYKEGYKKLIKLIKERGEFVPPLINSYMNLSPSMKVFGTAINDVFGDVEETGILLTIKDVYPDKLERHINSVKVINEVLNAKFRPKWWRRNLLQEKQSDKKS
ncbi:MAG: GNAT family N-acetyltransferase [Bacteroidales bacterium]